MGKWLAPQREFHATSPDVYIQYRECSVCGAVQQRQIETITNDCPVSITVTNLLWGTPTNYIRFE